MSMQPVKRPGVITFIGVILYIQAALAAVAAVMLFAYQTRIADAVATQSGTTPSDGTLTGLGIFEAIAAVLLFAVAAGLMAGRRGWRTFAAVVIGLRMASALASLFAVHGTAFSQSAWVQLLIGAFVLWALYAHDASHEYFDNPA